MAHIKFALPLAFLSGISATCAFANSELPNTQGFIENSRFDVTLKNVWMINTNNQLSEAGIGDQNAWAQGALLDYQSGWYRDVIGIDASWYSVVKLYANKDFAGRDLLRDSHGHAEGFNKVGQLYAKLKWEDEQAYARLYAGWKQLYKFGTLSVTRSRAAPSSWRGVSLESGWGDFVARAAWVNRFSERDEPEKRGFYTLKSNKSIDHIVTGDISWSPDKSTRVSWVAGESDNYLLRQGVEAQFALPLDEKASLLFRSAWYYNRGLAEWEGARGFTHSAQHIFALVGYHYHALESGIAWSKTKAPLENGLGHFYWHMGKNTRGAFNSPADGEGNDYVNDNEQMIYWYGKYVISPELTTGIFANYGFGAKYQGVELTQWEYGGFIAWAPNTVPGLSLFAGFGPSYSWKQVKGQPWLTDDKRDFHRSHGIGGGITMEYKFGLHNQ